MRAQPLNWSKSGMILEFPSPFIIWQLSYVAVIQLSSNKLAFSMFSGVSTFVLFPASSLCTSFHMHAADHLCSLSLQPIFYPTSINTCYSSIEFSISWLRKVCFWYTATHGICIHASGHVGWSLFHFPASSWI